MKPRAIPDACVHCGYSQTGLPAVHACPECGFQYDDQMYIIRAKGPWGLSALNLFAMLFTVVFFRSMAQPPIDFLAEFVGESIANGLGLLVLVAVVIWFVRIFIRLWTTNRYAAVTPTGIRARTLSGEISVPWSEFEYLQMRGFIPTLFARGKEHYCVQLLGVFGNRRRFDKFDDAAEAALGRYRRSRAEAQAPARDQPASG